MNICYLLISGLFMLLSLPPAVNAQGDNSLGMGYASSESRAAGSRTITKSKHFDIFLGKKCIGAYEVRKTQKGSVTEYHAKSETAVRIIGEIKVGYDLTCIFKDGMLLKSRVRSYRNGKLKSETLVNWTGSHYLIDIDGETSTKKTPIRLSSIQLYFEGPPTQFNSIFSEREATMKEIKKVKEGQYLIADPGKNRGTEFVYNDASVKEVNIAFTLGSFSLVQSGR